MFYTGPDLVIHRCVREDEIFDIIKDFHDEPCRGNFAQKRTTHKIIRMGYYWSSIFNDTKKYMESCHRCQRMGEPIVSNEISLQPQVYLGPFKKWALDFV